MAYKKIFAVPNPEGGGVCHFEDFDVALEFARSQGLGAGRILTDYLDEDGNPINPPPEEIERRVEALKREAGDMTVGELYDKVVKMAGPSSTPYLVQMSSPVSPQDEGKPSPVPYSILMRSPSPDIDPQGKEVYQASASAKELDRVIDIAEDFCRVKHLGPFIRAAFEAGVYRLEILVGVASINIYKHPNN